MSDALAETWRLRLRFVHKFAACEAWHDRDLDIFYLVKTWAVREQTPLEHAQALRSWKLQWAWPADGRSQTLAGAGVPLMKQYADAGLDMMYEHAQFEDGSTSVEAGVMQMLDRMRGGRWKVFKGDNDAWLDEVRTYHRDAKTGLIVKEADDAISASRYAMMMLRHARTDAAKADFRREMSIPTWGASDEQRLSNHMGSDAAPTRWRSGCTQSRATFAWRTTPLFSSIRTVFCGPTKGEATLIQIKAGRKCPENCRAIGAGPLTQPPRGPISTELSFIPT